MNSNWSRLKRKLNEDKQNKLRPQKRRRLNKASPKPWNNKKRSNKNESFLTKYTNSSSSNSAHFDNKIEAYRKQTPKKQLYEAINLVPPSSTDRNTEERKAFWNDLRLKLRARLPQSFLFKIITPLSDATNAQKSSKLHTIKADTKPTNIMAIDCEMVGMRNTSILARVSIVNYFGDVVYDQFVQPKHDPQCSKITDFREDITGITKEDLVKYGITFEQAQKEIIEVLKGRKIVGHAVDNDFAVIQCTNVLKRNYYTTIIPKKDETQLLSKRQAKKIKGKKRNGSWYFDTAKCELLHEDINRPRSLKFLLELYLGLHIQSDAHDSVIDAISTMAVYRAILPEIKAKTKEKKLEKKEEEKNKKNWKENQKKQRDKQKTIRRNRNVLNNYAYDNMLDKLIQRGAGEDNFERQMWSTNPYK